MVRSKRAVIGCILACLAIVAIASPAGAVVEAGIVGSGIHMQYGPQDAGGDYMGIASESYDFYSDALWGFTGWGDNFPTWSGSQRPPDGIGFGYVLLAFDPYTGEVWNDIPATHQALNPAGTYSGHTPSVSRAGVDGDGNPISSDVVQTDLGRGYTADTVYITGAFIPRPNNSVNEPFGAFVNTSADGGILAANAMGGLETAYNTRRPALLPDGAEIKTYAAADGDRPTGMYQDPGGDLDFDHDKTWGYVGLWNWGWGYYAGDRGGVADSIFGFEMDGIKGWMRLDFSGNHSGVRLTEYYFDFLPPPVFAPGDVNEDGVIDADDIDLMGDYILTGIAPTTGNYDLSDDGVTGGTNGAIDINDLDYLVRHLVETSAVDGDGNPIFGTQYGDFNLDGEIELGDLTRLGTYYGVGDTWSQGNANPHLDTDIELGDLTILGTYYGASNGGVDAIPEPMTMSLLAVGACLPLFRRKRR